MAKPSSRLRRFIGETSLQWPVDIMPRMPDSLRALLVNLIDYAGLYPPAGLALPAVLENYETYLASPESWMLNRLVLPAAKLPEAPLGDNWRVTLLVEGEPGPLPAQVETLETRLPHRVSLPTYCEASIGGIQGGFAKVRTGGLTPETIPSSEALADFLGEAASRHIAFKATAGLHHPIRSLHPLTYAPDSPCATMHGFVNVFVAAAFAIVGIAVLLVVIGGGTLLCGRSQLDPPATTAGQPVTITVHSGEQLDPLVKDLADLGLIRSAFWFGWFAHLQGLGSRLVAGDFVLDDAMSTSYIIQRLEGAPQAGTHHLLLTEGLTAGQMADKVAGAGLGISAAQYLAEGRH